MSYSDNHIITDKGSKPAPQYFDHKKDDYYPDLGFLRVIDSDSNNTNKSYSYTHFCRSLTITNDGEAEVTLYINQLSIVVKPGEVFGDSFELFTEFEVQAMDYYRLVVRA